MRKTKSIKIDDREITVKELTLKDIQELIDSAKTGVLPALEVLLTKACGITADDLSAYAPSEIEMLYDVFMDVNASFFRIADRLGLQQVAATLMKNIQSDFLNSLASLSARVTPAHGTTATGSQRRH